MMEKNTAEKSSVEIVQSEEQDKNTDDLLAPMSYSDFAGLCEQKDDEEEKEESDIPEESTVELVDPWGEEEEEGETSCEISEKRTDFPFENWDAPDQTNSGCEEIFVLCAFCESPQSCWNINSHEHMCHKNPKNLPVGSSKLPVHVPKPNKDIEEVHKREAAVIEQFRNEIEADKACNPEKYKKAAWIPFVTEDGKVFSPMASTVKDKNSADSDGKGLSTATGSAAKSERSRPNTRAEDDAEALERAIQNSLMTFAEERAESYSEQKATSRSLGAPEDGCDFGIPCEICGKIFTAESISFHQVDCQDMSPKSFYDNVAPSLKK